MRRNVARSAFAWTTRGRQKISSVLLLSHFYVNQFNFHFIVIPGKADAALIFNEAEGEEKKAKTFFFVVCKVREGKVIASIRVVDGRLFIHDSNPPSATLSFPINSRAEK